MSDCKTCGGCGKPTPADCGHNNCGACCGGGCALEKQLSAGERKLLERFAALPFLPLVQNRESGELSPLETGLSQTVARAMLEQLRRRGLVRIDPELPLSNYNYGDYGEDYTRGSAALTALGQETLDDMEYQ